MNIPKLTAAQQNPKRNFVKEMKEGLSVLKENKGLFSLLLIGTLYMFVYMPINALYPFSIKWLCDICNLLCNHGLFGTLLQWRANGTFPGEN